MLISENVIEKCFAKVDANYSDGLGMTYWKAQGLTKGDIDKLQEAVLDSCISTRLGVSQCRLVAKHAAYDSSLKSYTVAGFNNFYYIFHIHFECVITTTLLASYSAICRLQSQYGIGVNCSISLTRFTFIKAN
jgi:hypothetical protein